QPRPRHRIVTHRPAQRRGEPRRSNPRTPAYQPAPAARARRSLAAHAHPLSAEDTPVGRRSAGVRPAAHPPVSAAPGTRQTLRASDAGNRARCRLSPGQRPVRPLPTLHRQLMGVFAAFTLAVAALFGVFALLFTYAVEDQFFVDALRAEATLQQAHHQRSGDWLEPRNAYLSLHESTATLPADLREALAREPLSTEQAGDGGRHYHLLRIGADSDPSGAILVAEVSEQLVVRRMRGKMLRILGWTVLAVLSLALLVAWWLAHRTAAPLARLAREVAHLPLDESPALVRRAHGCREIETLAQAFDTLADRIR